MIKRLLGIPRKEFLPDLETSLKEFEKCGICNYSTQIPKGTPKETLGKRYIEGIGTIHPTCNDPLYTKKRFGLETGTSLYPHAE